MCGKFQGPPANGASLDGLLKMGCCQPAQNGPILKVFGYNLNVMKNYLYKMSKHVLDIIRENNQTYHTQHLVIIV